MQLFRALIPTWRFFDQVGDAPRLFYRLQETSGQLGQWQQCLIKPQRKWFHLFLNPSGNIYLAKQTVLNRILTDLNEDKTDPVTLNLLCKIVENEIPGLSAGGFKYQFMIQINQEAVMTSEIFGGFK